MDNKFLLPMNLQFFADEDQEGEDLGTSTETDKQQDKKDEETGKTFSRDEVAKMIAAETNKAKQSWQKELEEKENEAKKLAKMNAEEKAAHEKKQLEERIAEYERKEALRNMSKEASAMLKEKGVRTTDEILELLVNEDAEVTQKAVQGFIVYMNEAHKAWEIERNTGTTPRRTSSNHEPTLTQKIAERMAKP